MVAKVAYSLRCQQLHPDPNLGPLKHDHKLTLIFFSLHEGDLLNPWIKRGDPTVIWPRDWLPKEEEGLGDNILVLSVECHVARKTPVSVPLERILVRDLVMNTKWKLDRAQTIVLVGHGIGGLVIKSLIESLCFVEKSQEASCKAFKQNIKGIVFYNVPHTTSKEEFVNYCSFYTMMFEKLLNDFNNFNLEMVRLNERFQLEMAQLNERFEESIELDMAWWNQKFEKSIEHQRIILFAFVEGQKVMVPQFSTYKLVQNNVCEIEDADHFQVSQPLDQQHASYKRLLQFIQEDLGHHFQVSQPFDQQDASYKQWLQLIEEDLVHTQKLDVMIRTIEDVRINFPRDLQFLAPKEVLGKTSIVCVGGKAIEGDSVEFLFMHAGDMSKVVGVGLHWAKVVVTKEFGVNVVQEDEGIWTKLWRLEHFVPRIIIIPNPKQELMTHPNSAKTDGVELEANLGSVYVEDEKEENAHACFPLVFELAEHIGLGRGNAMKMKEVSGEHIGLGRENDMKMKEVAGEGSSGSTKDGVNTRRQLKRKIIAKSFHENLGAESSGTTKRREVSGVESSGSSKGGEASGVKSSGSTKDGEISGGKSNQSRSSGSRQETRRNENDEGSEDPSKGPPNPLDPSLSIGREDIKEKILTVNVYPKARQLAVPGWGRASLPSICPTLVFKFQRKGECRTIDVKVAPQCNFGKRQNGATKNGLGFYQDDITISLDCIDEDAARMTMAHVQDVENVKKAIGNTSTKMHSSTHQAGGGLEFDATLPHDVSFHARMKYNHAQTRGDNLTHGNTKEMYFRRLNGFSVEDYSTQNELNYMFKYPQEALEEIALGDSSQIKTETTFWPTIESTWGNLNMKVRSPYIFSVERHIFSKEHMIRLLNCGEGTSMITQHFNDTHLNVDEEHKVLVIKQCYKVNLRVNHAMTHMPLKAEDKDLFHSDTDPMIIDGVMGMSSSTSE